MGRHSKPALTDKQVARIRYILKADEINDKDIIKRFNISKDKLRAYRRELVNDQKESQ